MAKKRPSQKAGFQLDFATGLPSFGGKSGNGGGKGLFGTGIEFGDIMALSAHPGFAFLRSMFEADRADTAAEEHRDLQLDISRGLESVLTESGERALTDVTRFSEMNLADSEQFFGNASALFESVADPLRGMIRGRTQAGIAGADELVGLQQERERRLLAEAEGLGEAERGELNRRFQNLEQTERSRLGGLGFSGSAISSVASGARRAGSAELSLLNERLQRERLELSGELSGETLKLRGEALDFATGLRADQIQSFADLGFGGIDFQQQALQSLLTDRFKFGLAPAEQEAINAQNLVNLYTQDIIFEPPREGQENVLASLAGTQG